jgi:hypothetical protein
MIAIGSFRHTTQQNSHRGHNNHHDKLSIFLDFASLDIIYQRMEKGRAKNRGNQANKEQRKHTAAGSNMAVIVLLPSVPRSRGKVYLSTMPTAILFH